MDSQWANDPGMRKYLEFLAKAMPGADKADGLLETGYTTAQAAELVLRRCGYDVTRENIMRQAASLEHISLDLFLPGIEINTGPTDYDAIQDMQLMRFEGASWKLFGPLIREAPRE